MTLYRLFSLALQTLCPCPTVTLPLSSSLLLSITRVLESPTLIPTKISWRSLFLTRPFSDSASPEAPQLSYALAFTAALMSLWILPPKYPKPPTKSCCWGSHFTRNEVRDQWLLPQSTLTVDWLRPPVTFCIVIPKVCVLRQCIYPNALSRSNNFVWRWKQGVCNLSQNIENWSLNQQDAFSCICVSHSVSQTIV